jgi:hypothetical protein
MRLLFCSALAVSHYTRRKVVVLEISSTACGIPRNTGWDGEVFKSYGKFPKVYLPHEEGWRRRRAPPATEVLLTEQNFIHHCIGSSILMLLSWYETHGKVYKLTGLVTLLHTSQKDVLIKTQSIFQ